MPHFLVGRPERFSLMHGDYRLDNLMFHPDGTVAAVDWQTLGVGLAGRDLAYLIATSLEPDARREAEHAAIAAYHDRLVGLTAGAEWLHTKNKLGIYYQHLNLGNATSLGSDGRQLFWNPEGYSSNCWTAGGATVGYCATGSCTMDTAPATSATLNSSLKPSTSEPR